MVTLFCAFVGTKESVFPVHIDASQSVGHLKDAIKMDNQRRITCDANDLQLYPAKTKIDTAKTEDGKWLSSSTEDVKKLKEGEKTSHVVELTKEDREMQGEDSITQLLAGMETPKARQIYVLVVIPDHEQQLHAQNEAAK
ncbi:unnamed protein product [Peronospora farinosa]|uniref:Crinkler effector protein N-terminal domain-containing protein n=1 Tax=Peronospora farinosa TaxID=134698 RepID=A0AAV0U1S5_9STRA|nr:unnamed protein product [Peronospora farinosa]